MRKVKFAEFRPLPAQKQWNVTVRVYRDGVAGYEEKVVQVEADDVRPALHAAVQKATTDAHADDAHHIVSNVTTHGLYEVQP